MEIQCYVEEARNYSNWKLITDNISAVVMKCLVYYPTFLCSSVLVFVSCAILVAHVILC